MKPRLERQNRFKLSLTPFKIAVLYALAGGVWILFSDKLLSALVSDPDQITRIEIFKGWFYVALTAIILYLIISRFERSVQNSERNYKMLMNQAADGIFLSDDHGRHLDANQKACEMLGYSKDELLARNARDLMDPDELAVMPLRFDELRAGKTIIGIRTMRHKDGSTLPTEVNVTMLEDGRILAIVRNISERMRSEKIILQQNRQLLTLSQATQQINAVLEIPAILRTLVTSAVDLVDAESGMAGLATGDRLVFTEYNDKGQIFPIDCAFSPGYGVPGGVMLTRQPYISNDAEHDPCVTPEIQNRLNIYSLAEIPILNRKGELLGCFEIHNKKDHGPFEDGDVSLLKGLAASAAIALENAHMLLMRQKLEEQLRQSQKMEAVGILAGGIAHDFNNILTAIIGYGNLVIRNLKSDDPLHSYVEQILGSSERAASLTHSLLAFSRKQIINPQPVDVNDIILRVEKLLRRLIGEDIELKTFLVADALTVRADSGQIEQVLMNLATNARDAMPDGGRLIIQTELVSTDRHDAQNTVNLKPGSYVLISVTDTGTGMDEATRERIFDPFFTTKEVGKGTGLGLAMAYGIVSQHDGIIEATSEPGRGSTFRIYLPVIASIGKTELPAASEPLQQGTETILLAEDDDMVRRLTRTVLEEAGYTVIEASDGVDAFNKFTQDPDRIKLLMLDVIMPKANGKDVYERIHAINPEVRVLFTSGYTAEIIHKKEIIEQGLNFIAKPASPKELICKVRAVLDQ